MAHDILTSHKSKSARKKSSLHQGSLSFLPVGLPGIILWVSEPEAVRATACDLFNYFCLNIDWQASWSHFSVLWDVRRFRVCFDLRRRLLVLSGWRDVKSNGYLTLFLTAAVANPWFDKVARLWQKASKRVCTVWCESCLKVCIWILL